MTEPAANVEAELARIVAALRDLGRPHALVGGLATSIRGEVRFTRDVDLAIASDSDASTERLVGDLTARGYQVAALVEHDSAGRLATARLRTRVGVNVDLLAASSGIEPEVVDAARDVDIEGVGPVRVAVAEDLLALKVLSMAERRPQDRFDAAALVLANPDLDLAIVRDRLALITARGFDRGEDLLAKLDGLLADVSRE
jgi:hypothetical protein